jgi:putative ATP-binding cassette transporter
MKLTNFWYAFESRKAKLYIGICSTLILIEVGLTLYLNSWRNDFWTSIEKHNIHDFWQLILVFTIVAFSLMIVSGYTGYLQSKASLAWREQLVAGIANKDNLGKNIDYPEQRIADDTREYTNTGIGITLGALRAVVSVIAFSFMIIKIMPWFFLFIPLITSGVSTVISKILGIRICNLNYVSQKLEAKFRDYLTVHRRDKTHFDTADALEVFKPVTENYLTIFKWTKYLSYFQSAYFQANVIVPYLVIAPLYFALKLSFGLFMQAAGALNSVADNLGYLVAVRSDLARWQSSRLRLQEITHD